MKRILCTLLILILICIGATACGSESNPPETDLPETDQETEAPTPEGYTIYDNGAIAFAYPEDWTITDGSAVILVNPSGVGNNITVAYEAKNDFYGSMSVSDFETHMKPLFEQMGMVISNPSVEQTKNKNGLAITKISFSNTVSGVQMKQTMYISTSGDRTYTVTVTETTPDAVLVETVFNTLKAN